MFAGDAAGMYYMLYVASDLVDFNRKNQKFKVFFNRHIATYNGQKRKEIRLCSCGHCQTVSRFNWWRVNQFSAYKFIYSSLGFIMNNIHIVCESVLVSNSQSKRVWSPWHTESSDPRQTSKFVLVVCKYWELAPTWHSDQK